jgi:N5-(cytidine 5'-diphosphoramidyl)-L-glutamine hydrolase
VNLAPIPVGVTQRSLPPTEFGERRHALDARWPVFLAACGLACVPLPNLPGLAVRTAEALGLRGLVLTGGDDLAEFGGATPDRDATEARLLAWALTEGLPVLGVCRGMQVIARAFGAGLVPVAGHVAVRHEVDLAGGGVRTVNSYHRMAVPAGLLPPALEASAVHEDVAEAVRHRSAPVEGVMWHPEREDPPDPLDVRTVGRLMRGEQG